MALDFPASPTNGQLYQTLGLTFIWDSGTSKWRAINGPQYKKAVCVATRNTGSETLSPNINYPVIGAYLYNYQNLFGYGTTGGLAGGILIPYTGLYRVDNQIYNLNVTGAGGRLGICINNAAAQSAFVQFPAGAASAAILLGTALLALNAGDSIGYRTETNTVNIHSAGGHTQLTVEYMGDA